MDPVIASGVFVLGLAFGSFLNVCIYRLPLGLSVVRPGSACPHCEKPIRFYDNIPVLAGSSFTDIAGSAQPGSAPDILRLSS